MATPIIQKINAFNASEGTTILFNIVGSSAIIRSSKITIYDSNNNKICTHIYNSTQLQHVIPANTDETIVYESGKTYLDFSNGYSYSMTIDVYGSVDAQGESLGTSSRVQFWCLDYPVLQFINPSVDVDIQTSSYIFNANCTIVYPIGVSVPITNRVQSYKFDLYKGGEEGSVLKESSGNIYGTGNDLGNNVYSLSYNFSNLENGGNYYVVLSIVTEQGMKETATSDIISVVLEDVAFSITEVRNNACNGCIEISSNITNIIGVTNAIFEEGDGHIDLSYIQCTEDSVYSPDETYYIYSDNKYIATEVDEETFNANKTHYYTASDYYIEWGTNEGYLLNFPITTISVGNTMRWSMIIKASSFISSNSSIVAEDDNSYFLNMSSLNRDNGIYVYMRRDNNDIFAELYAYTSNSNKTSFITSNILENIDDETDIYMLLRCYDGWYDIKLATELPS